MKGWSEIQRTEPKETRENVHCKQFMLVVKGCHCKRPKLYKIKEEDDRFQGIRVSLVKDLQAFILFFQFWNKSFTLCYV